MKKFKKYSILMAALVVTVSATACSKPETAPSGAQGSQSTNGAIEEMMEVEPNAMSYSMGKITSIVGNQIKVAIGTLEFEEGYEDTMLGEGMIVEGMDGGVMGGGDVFILDDNYSGPVAEMLPDDMDMGDVQFEIVGGEGLEPLELEYTGEEKEVTIASNVDIVNIFGQKVTLDTLKKGTLVTLVFDKSGENLVEVSIME